MSKLYRADMLRSFKGYTLYICSLLIVFVNWLTAGSMKAEDPTAISEIIFQTFGLVVTMIIGFGIALFITFEYTNGAIRNKIIIGYSRREIALGWFSVSCTNAFIMFCVHIMSSFAFGCLYGLEMSNINTEALFVNLLVLYVELVSFVILIVVIATLAHGYLCLVFVYIVAGLISSVFQFTNELIKDKEIMSFIYRFFIQGQFELNAYEIIDKPWLSMICTLSLGALIMILGIWKYNKLDLK